MADYGGPSGPSSSNLHRWSRLKDEPTIAIPFAASASSKALTTRDGILAGFTFISTGGAAAACRIWDGSSNNGTMLASLEMALNAGEVAGPGVDGPLFEVGLYLEVVTGSVEGVVWVKI